MQRIAGYNFQQTRVPLQLQHLTLTYIMIDQRARLSAKGIATEFVGEAPLDEAANQAVVGGKVQLVFISPCLHAMLTSPVYKEHLCAFVIDEACCVKSWQAHHIDLACTKVKLSLLT